MQRALHLVKNIFVLFVMFAAACMIFFIAFSFSTNHSNWSFFGYRLFIVLSDSMRETDFAAGDLIISKEVDPSKLKAGDIISYLSINKDNYGVVVTHKIRKLVEDTEGNPGFITYGTSTNTDDENIVTYDFVLGKYQMRFPGVGKFFHFLRTVPGYILCIFLPFLILILWLCVNSIVLFSKYKREQLAVLEAEYEKKKQELAVEQKRLEMQQIELQETRAELFKTKRELSDLSDRKCKTEPIPLLDDSEII